MKRKQLLLIAIFIAILLLTLFFHTNPKKQTPVPIGGYLDLSDWSFEEDGLVSLSGEWEFYFNEFLDPSDLEVNNADEVYYISVPSNIKSMNKVKPFESDHFYGTMRLVIDLPDKNQIYGLKSDIVLSAYELFIDGLDRGEAGIVGENRASSKPSYKIIDSYFKPDMNRVVLLYHTSDFYFSDCAITAPQIGLADQITSNSKLRAGRDLFLFGMLLTMGLYHMGLYIIRKKEKAPLYFGIFCLVFGLRMLIVGERVLPSMIPFDFLIYSRIAYLTVYVGFASLCAFLYFNFDELFPKWYIKMSFGLAMISILITTVSSFELIDLWLLPYACVGFSLMGYTIYKLIIGIKEGIPFSGWVLVSFLCILLSFINDFIYEITLANHDSMIPLGITVFIMTQAYTLSAKFSNAFFHVEKLSAENESILLEMKHVNANLENIVENRTRDLREALSEMDLMSKTDYLTKLPNRRMMFQKIEELIQNNAPFFIAIADIDKFKVINDTYGHDKGDLILQDLSERLSKSLGDNGFVGRWGGEEFLIILYGSDSIKALRISEEIRKKIASKYNIIIHSPITITIGLCAYNKTATLDVAIANADKALYEGKLGGRNQCRLYRM